MRPGGRIRQQFFLLTGESYGFAALVTGAGTEKSRSDL